MQIPPGLEPFARSTDLPRAGVRLFHYDAGSRALPAMLLVHGLGDESDTWRKVILPLSETHRVIAPDLPGFGRSTLPRGRAIAPSFLCAALLELLETLGISRAAWVGSSMGASLSQLAVLSHPQKASRLFLVDGGLLAMSKLPPALLKMLIPVAGERMYLSLKDDADAAYATLAPYYAHIDRLPADDQAFLRRRVMDRVASVTQRKAYFSMFRSYCTWMALRGKAWKARARTSDTHTTYIWGAGDLVIPVAAGRAACAEQKDARIEVIPGAGHLPQQEAPEALLRVLNA
jgi:pimeloyl-ACP methyl ester carboxylesterase